MKIVVTANGEGLDAQVSPMFGRCPVYVFVDTDSMDAQSVANSALSAQGGAGIQAAQFVVEQRVEAALTGNIGPNAYQVLHAANVQTYLAKEGTVRQAVEDHKAGTLKLAEQANTEAHTGTRGMGGPTRRR